MFRALLLCIFCLLPLHAQYSAANPEWNRLVEPFRIVGNLYYVGASGVSSFLISTPEGLILLDTGYRETVPLIEANLKKLGFRMEDIRFVLVSHGHVDHAGGVADVERSTKARFLVSPKDAPLFSHGGKGDFQWGDTLAFPPVEPDGLLKEGEPVRLGNSVLTPHFTPGHTKGCTSWATTVQDGGRDYRVVIACSLSAPGYRLIGNAKYPEIMQDFESSFAQLRAMPCDIFLGGHGWDFGLEKKMQARAEGSGRNPFVDADALGEYVDRSEAKLRQQAAEQKGK